MGELRTMLRSIPSSEPFTLEKGTCGPVAVNGSDIVMTGYDDVLISDTLRCCILLLFISYVSDAETLT